MEAEGYCYNYAGGCQPGVLWRLNKYRFVGVKNVGGLVTYGSRRPKAITTMALFENDIWRLYTRYIDMLNSMSSVRMSKTLTIAHRRNYASY